MILEAYKELLRANEAAVNKLASRVSRIELYIMILLCILCIYDIMYVPGVYARANAQADYSPASTADTDCGTCCILIRAGSNTPF